MEVLQGGPRRPFLLPEDTTAWPLQGPLTGHRHQELLLARKKPTTPPVKTTPFLLAPSQRVRSLTVLLENKRRPGPRHNCCCRWSCLSPRAAVRAFHLRKKLGPVVHLRASPERGDGARENKPRPAPDLATRVQERSRAFVRCEEQRKASTEAGGGVGKGENSSSSTCQIVPFF